MIRRSALFFLRASSDTSEDWNFSQAGVIQDKLVTSTFPCYSDELDITALPETSVVECGITAPYGLWLLYNIKRISRWTIYDAYELPSYYPQCKIEELDDTPIIVAYEYGLYIPTPIETVELVEDCATAATGYLYDCALSPGLLDGEPCYVASQPSPLVEQSLGCVLIKELYGG